MRPRIKIQYLHVKLHLLFTTITDITGTNFLNNLDLMIVQKNFDLEMSVFRLFCLKSCFFNIGPSIFQAFEIERELQLCKNYAQIKSPSVGLIFLLPYISLCYFFYAIFFTAVKLSWKIFRQLSIIGGISITDS